MYTAKFLWPQFSGCIYIYIHSIHHRIMNYILHIYSEHFSSREHFSLGSYCPKTFERAKGKKEKWCHQKFAVHSYAASYKCTCKIAFHFRKFLSPFPTNASHDITPNTIVREIGVAAIMFTQLQRGWQVLIITHQCILMHILEIELYIKNTMY